MSSSLQKINNRDNDIEEGINTNPLPSSTSVEYSVPSNSPTQDSHCTATVPSTTQANSMFTTTGTGPELIDADDEPPLPMGMAEAALDTAKDDPEREGPEHIDDNIGPDYSMDIESTFVDDKDAAADTARVEQIDDESAPTPYDSTEFEEGVDTKKRKKAEQATVYHEDTIRIPTIEDIDGEVEFATSRVRRT